MKARLERFEMRAGRKRQLALRVMGEADIQKLTQSDFTASLKQGAPMLDVVDEAKVPAAYWKPQPSKLDRQGLLGGAEGRCCHRRRRDRSSADAVKCEDTVMALTDIQTKSLKAKLKRRHVKMRVELAALRFPTLKAGTPSPKPTASLALIVGTGRRWPHAVIGRICSTARPCAFIQPRFASRSGPATP